MTTANELLNQLTQQGIQLWAEGDKLKFKAPKGALTDEYRTLLKAHKVELLKILATPDQVPLTPGQEGIWYTEQLRPGTAAYNTPMAWRIKGALDLDVLEQSLNFMGQRHAVFRTYFEVKEGYPSVVINPSVSFTLNKTDLQQVSPTERDRQASERVHVEADYPFDLARPPLLRASIIQLAPTEFIFTMTIHHMISDGWSIGVLAQELSQIYNALSVGETPVLPDLPIQYADFARWQQTQRENEAFTERLEYWQQKLTAAPPVLELPTDYARPAIFNDAGGQVSLALPPELAEAVKALSRQQNATFFMTLLTAFKILLYHYTREANIVVGSPIIHRPQPELEHLIGYFLNNLVLHTELSEEPTFIELLSNVRRTSLEAYAHQDVPYETIVQSLQPERDLSYNPLFQVAFNLLTTSQHSGLDLAGLTIESVSRTEIQAYSKFDLTLYVRQGEADLHFYLVYRTDLFRPERMDEMLTQYQYLLEQIVADPTRTIDDYSLVTPSAQTIVPDPLTPVPAPPQPLVTDLVAAWAEKTPHKTAISHREQTWSYQTLVGQVDGIARSLQAMGVQPGDVVAISGPRQFGLIASIIGTLLGGGAFILVDPFLPEARKSILLQEAQAKWLISVQGATNLPSIADWLTDEHLLARQLQVDGETGQLISPLDISQVTLPAISEDDPAYIFFTSGSTGKPKAILGSHKGVSHFVRWQGEAFDIGPEDRVAQLIGPSFDVILRDIFLPLTQGATLCLPDKVDGLNLADPLPWFKEARITILHTVPALVQTWLSTGDTPTLLPDMRYTFLAGEPLTDALVTQWRAYCPNSQVVNLYGPTETTMVKCFYPVPIELQPGVQSIGRPLPQTQVFVLAENNRQCGLYEPGQIAIRTPFRTLGYLNAPEVAKKQFRPNPFQHDPEDLFYYTGDLGYYQADGTLAILGRTDDQVKVRGVRIELGEIIGALAKHPRVQANTVIAKKDAQGQNYLVAYVVPQSTDEFDATVLQRDLSKILVPAMIPSAFVPLERLPLLPTGKVDRRQLPEPDLSVAYSTEAFVEPEGLIEEMIAEVWQAVLGLERISLYDNFFHLGGHSLLAIQVVARFEQEYGIELPLRILFDAPRIAELAPLIEEILTTEEA
ncbi:MAG: amino acid adenylation domain-containing protein [Chloroflexota bacterium]